MNDELVERFAELTELLQTCQPCWRPVAFYEPDLPWVAEHPQLAKDLLALPADTIERLATDERALAGFFSAYFPFANRIISLLEWPSLPEFPRPQIHPRFHAGMPGRKWQQVQAFARHLPSAGPILEWCAGKSHLGFWLQHCLQQPVTALEIDENLVAQANARAAQFDIPLQSHALDVMTVPAEGFVQHAKQLVALHACGGLHERLLQAGAASAVPEIHLAPCCYHKRAEPLYVPLSQQGRKSGMHLQKQELHLAVMETATAGARIQRRRRALQMKRLGFDALQREIGFSQQYLPLPSLPDKWADADFETFCRHCARLKNLQLPASVNWNHFQKRGEERFWRVSAFDLLRFLFRRPLEIWLALDRALMLVEHNYSVRLGIFCSADVTPRNLLLQAWHS